MKRLSYMLGVSIVGTFLTALLGINFTEKLSPILFTVCGILFSVGLSQIINYDISKITNEEIFDEMTRSVKSIRNLIVMQFYYTCIAFLGLEIINENPIMNVSIPIRKFDLSLERFLNILLIYCVFYFLNLFRVLSEKKLNLASIIRKESLEEESAK